MILRKQKTFSILQYNTLKSTVVRTVQQLVYTGWHQVNQQEEYKLEIGEEIGDGRAEAWSAIGDRGQAEISLTPHVDGMHVYIFESSNLKFHV